MSDPTVTQSTPPSQSAPLQPFPDPIPGIIPFGTVTLFAGAPGVGKTAMLAEWCRRWRDGRPICGHPTNPPTAFYYLAADRGWASDQKWFDAVGFGPIPHYSLADDLSYDLVKLSRAFNAAACFQDCLAKLNPIPGAHLFVDPVSPLFISGNPNQARDVATSMLRLTRVAQERQINITCTAHFGKQKADPNEQYTRPQDRIAGSGAFSGFSDTQIYLVDPMPPEQPYHLLGWNPRHSAPEEFKFVRNRAGLFVPYELYTEIGLRQQIVEVIPYEPHTTAQLLSLIHAAFDLPVRTIERYLKSLVHEGLVVKVRHGLYQRAKPS